MAGQRGSWRNLGENRAVLWTSKNTGKPLPLRQEEISRQVHECDKLELAANAARDRIMADKAAGDNLCQSGL